MNYELRNCTLEDLGFVLELKRLGMKWYIEKLYGWDIDVQKEKTLEEMKSNLHNMKIIIVEGKDVGVTTFCEHEEFFEVGLIIIHPDYQNRGIATCILKEYIKTAKNKRKRIIIKTYKENPAHKLYTRLGFNVYKIDNTHLHLCIDFGN